LSLTDLFTGRALRNIDLIIENLPESPENLRRALLLTLTASVGQMSNMVFAITERGKTKGAATSMTEVGSWVIGYWRPPIHFEINVWNCYKRRADKLVAILSNLQQPRSYASSLTVDPIFDGDSYLALLNADSLATPKHIPSSSGSLVLTDPPHSDRIPYLELSEIWNAILGKDVQFQDEIVVSNAQKREKTTARYIQKMTAILSEIDRILIPGGTLVLLFNARDTESWTMLNQGLLEKSLNYSGCFPMNYSANSVIQDNRAGAMKTDYVLVYHKTGGRRRNVFLEEQAMSLPGWSKEFPKRRGGTNGIHVSNRE